MNITNEKLRTSNEILKKLNEIYFVCKSINGTSNDFNIYKRESQNSMNFVFSVNVKPGVKDRVFFNNKKYTDVDQLLADVEKFNDSRFFPSDCYNPDFLISSREESKIHWYLTRVLGMERGNWMTGDRDNYILRNVYGEPIVTISYEMDYRYGKGEKDRGNGVIMRRIGDSDYIYPKFNNAEHAVKVINSIVGVESLMNFKTSLDTLKKLSGGFSEMNNVTVENMKTILSGGSKEKYNDMVIPILEELLKKLKEGKNDEGEIEGAVETV